LVDGIPSSEDFVMANNGENIEKIEIVKSTAGTVLYGSRGYNGIIAITTNNQLRRRDSAEDVLSKGQIIKVVGYKIDDIRQ
jgi:hypothetical protein